MSTKTPKVTVHEFLQRVLFCWVTGNGDMHLKNWSLIENGPLVLFPFAHGVGADIQKDKIVGNIPFLSPQLWLLSGIFPILMIFEVFELYFEGPSGEVDFAEAEKKGGEHEDQGEAEESLSEQADFQKEKNDRQNAGDQAQDSRGLHPADEDQPPPQVVDLPLDGGTALGAVALVQVARDGGDREKAIRVGQQE